MSTRFFRMTGRSSNFLSRGPLEDDVDFMAFDAGHMGRRGASVALAAYPDALLEDGQTLKSWGEER